MSNKRKEGTVILVAIKHPFTDLEVSCYTKTVRFSKVRQYINDLSASYQFDRFKQDGLLMITDTDHAEDLPENMYYEEDKNGSKTISKITGTVVFCRIDKMIPSKGDFYLKSLTDDDIKIILHQTDEDYQKELAEKYHSAIEGKVNGKEADKTN